MNTGANMQMLLLQLIAAVALTGTYAAVFALMSDQSLIAMAIVAWSLIAVDILSTIVRRF